MNVHAVLSAIGADRPGLVEAVSEFVFRNDGNIEDSRMANLHGQFTMMLLISAPPEALRKMQAAAPVLIQKTHLHVEIRPAGEQPIPSRPAVHYRLSASAMDQAGLVHRITHLLRSLDVNIESMETSLVAAPHSGSPVFEMELLMSAPGDLPSSELRDKLGTLCDQLNVDWNLVSV